MLIIRIQYLPDLSDCRRRGDVLHEIIHESMGENATLSYDWQFQQIMSKVDDWILLSENLQWNILKLVQSHISPYREMNDAQ